MPPASLTPALPAARMSIDGAAGTATNPLSTAAFWSDNRRTDPFLSYRLE
ncbi:hypothetical protein [Burkholderia sp. BCC1985]|nr:hypothetical protein [Burkholderia sp. BCC1985]